MFRMVPVKSLPASLLLLVALVAITSANEFPWKSSLPFDVPSLGDSLNFGAQVNTRQSANALGTLEKNTVPHSHGSLVSLEFDLESIPVSLDNEPSERRLRHRKVHQERQALSYGDVLDDTNFTATTNITLPTGIFPCGPAHRREVALWPGKDAANIKAIRTDYLEACLESTELPQTMIGPLIHHVETLQKLFQENYAFYHIAKDPSGSMPQSHQPELGNTIYSNEEGQGQVDLEKELNSLLERIRSVGANSTPPTVSVFWDLHSIFNRLRDGHVSLPKLPWCEVAGSAFCQQNVVVPERSYTGGDHRESGNKTTFQSKLEFSTDADGALQLKIWWKNDDDGSETFDVVTKMNNKSVEQFFVDLANSPANESPHFLSQGARLNSLLAYNLRVNDETYFGYDHLFLAVFTPEARTSDLFPPTFQVEYQSGETETYYTGGIFPGLGSFFYANKLMRLGLNQTRLSEAIGVPGKAYSNYQRAMVTMATGSSTARKLSTVDLSERYTMTETVSTTEVTAVDSPTTRRLENENGTFLFDAYFEDDGIRKVAYRIETDHAILKIQNFALSAEQSIGIWRNMTLAAKAAGVKKLLIDISRNGGGTVAGGQALAVSMFPFTPFDRLDTEDRTYNYAMASAENIISIANGMLAGINVASPADLQLAIESYTEQQLQSMSSVANAAAQLCLDNCRDFQVGCQGCSLLQSTKQAVSDFLLYRSPPLLTNVFQSFIPVLSLFSPYVNTIAPSFGRSVVRGGVEYNLTSKFTALTYDLFSEAVASAFQIDHFFDEYVIVSDGASGSTTAIFESMVSQLWKNRDQATTGPSVTTVSYGGLSTTASNAYGDTTMAGFPAAVLKNFDIGVPIVSNMVYLLLEQMIPPEDEALATTLRAAIMEYEKSIVAPPYFANSLPTIAFANWYNAFMEPGALPLQYVVRPPDSHIAQIFLRNTISDPADLQELYLASSSFFSNQPGPAPAPVPRPSGPVPPNQGSSTTTGVVQSTRTTAATSKASTFRNGSMWFIAVASLILCL